MPERDGRRRRGVPGRDISDRRPDRVEIAESLNCPAPTRSIRPRQKNNNFEGQKGYLMKKIDTDLLIRLYFIKCHQWPVVENFKKFPWPSGQNKQSTVGSERVNQFFYYLR